MIKGPHHISKDSGVTDGSQGPRRPPHNNLPDLSERNVSQSVDTSRLPRLEERGDSTQ